MSSYFKLRHSRSMNTLSIHRPRPSIEMRTPAAPSVPVKAALVNWLPWSVLKIAGLPKRASASSSADTQNDTSIVFDSRHASTARLAHLTLSLSKGDHRDQVEKPAPDRNVGDVGRPYLVRPLDRQVPEEIREDLVPRRRFRRPRLRPQRRDAHPPHQSLHMFAVDRVPLRPQHRRHPPRAEEMAKP